MAVIEEHQRVRYTKILLRAEVGKPLYLDDQGYIMGIYWPDFKREYGLELIDFYHGAPVTQAFIDAFRKDLGLDEPLEPEEDIWL